jgi:hypothetical protein
MEFDVLIYPDGKRTHETTKREEGENCERLTQFNAGSVLSSEKTGPDCDRVEEVQG